MLNKLDIQTKQVNFLLQLLKLKCSNFVLTPIKIIARTEILIRITFVPYNVVIIKS